MGADISIEVREKVKIMTQEEQKETIIIVDDNEDQLTMLKFLLAIERPSHNIITFSSAEQALEFLDNNNVKKNYIQYLDRFYSSVSLVISDYNMYPKNGLDFYKEMKNCGLSIPFVLISSFVSDKIKYEAKNLGINDCIDKDVDISKTINSLSSFLPT
jgi:CheY-like chemotaxis protein